MGVRRLKYKINIITVILDTIIIKYSVSHENEYKT